MEIHDLVTVYTVSNPVGAQIIRNALQAEGIHCFLDGINQAAEPGIGVFEIKIQVPAVDADRATHFIKAHDEHRRGK